MKLDRKRRRTSLARDYLSRVYHVIAVYDYEGVASSGPIEEEAAGCDVICGGYDCMVERAVEGCGHAVSFWQIWPYERRECHFYPALAAIEHTDWGERSACHG